MCMPWGWWLSILLHNANRRVWSLMWFVDTKRWETMKRLSRQSSEWDEKEMEWIAGRLSAGSARDSSNRWWTVWFRWELLAIASMNSALPIEMHRVFVPMWRNCSPIDFCRVQTIVKFLSKWIAYPIHLFFRIVCVWKPKSDWIGGRFSVREHSSRFFNFASDNMNSSERTLSIDPKTGTGTRTGTEIGTEIGIGSGTGNGNGNGSGSGNEFNSPENDDPNQLTFSLDLHSPFPFHKTPSWNTGIARSVEPIRSFDLHRSVDSINSDSYFFPTCQSIGCRLRRDTPSPIMSPRATPSFPHSAMQYQMIPTHYMIRLLIQIRSASQVNDSIRVLHVTLEWNPQEVTLLDLVNRLLEHLSLSLSYASSFLQTINNGFSKVSYLQGPFLQDNPRIERIDAKSLLSSLRLSFALPVIEQQQMWLSFIYDPQSESIEKLCDSFENACCSYLPHGKQHIDEIRLWRLQFRNSLDDSVALHVLVECSWHALFASTSGLADGTFSHIGNRGQTYLIPHCWENRKSLDFRVPRSRHELNT